MAKFITLGVYTAKGLAGFINNPETDRKAATSALFVETARSQFHMIGIWKSKSHMIKARPKMIEFLNTLRHTLKKLSPRLGVTDPASGSVIIKK
jgi:hypothetical protein